MLKKCPDCGEPVQDGDVVCSSCGRPLSVSVQSKDETQPMADASGQVGNRTHRLSESEKNVTFDRIGAREPAEDGGSQKARRGVTGILVPILMVALVFSLVANLQMAKRLFEQEPTGGGDVVTGGSDSSEDDSAAENPPSEEGDDGQSDPGAQEGGEEIADDGTSGGEAEGEAPSDSAEEKMYPGLIGTWTGTLQPTTDSAYCYGASELPMILDIKDIADNGMITADMHVCFHGHSGVDNSAAVTEGDRYIDFEDMALTCSNGRIIYDNDKLNEYPGMTCMLYIQIDIADIDTDKPQMNGFVNCTYDLWDSMGNSGHQDDYYVFAKS